MIAAVVTFLVMVAALYERVESELAGEKRANRIICIPDNAAVEFYPCFGKSRLSSRSDSAANEDFNAVLFQKSRKSTVSASVCGNDNHSLDFSVLGVVELEVLRVTEMPEYLSVIVCYRNFHNSSFLVHG